MEFIKDKTQTIVMALDDNELYYFDQEPDEFSELNETEIMNLFINGECESILYEQLKDDSDGWLKLETIIELQEEMDIISNVDYIINEIKNKSLFLAKIITEYEKSIAFLSDRIVLLEIEGSGSASAWMDFLFLVEGNNTFDLCSSRKGYFSASEKIEYFGLGEHEYWNQTQANGEFIEDEITDIKTVKELHDGIVLLLKNDEQWNLNEDEIDWVTIVDVLLHNKATHKLGVELRLVVFKK